MNLQKIFALTASKSTVKLCRLLNLGGTSLPGLVASKVYPDILKVLSNGFKVIMVTGTNGKTTTTKIISKILDENNVEYITNRSGANMLTGITTTFIDSSNVKGYIPQRIALLEVDEASLKIIVDYIKPDILLVTNFFRDQLDRYGELYGTLSNVTDAVKKCPNTTLILNADDSLCVSVSKSSKGKTVFFGIDHEMKNAEKSLSSDAAFCIFCKGKYVYDYHVYGHLGGFRCPNCGYKKPDTDISCTSVPELTSNHSVIDFEIKDSIAKKLKLPGDWTFPQKHTSKINLPGTYNIYNALSAVSLSTVLGFPVENTQVALANFESSFGRMETIELADKTIKLILVKNPAGFNQVLNYLLTEDKDINVAFAINDNLADGIDVSWLWDVDFEKLTPARKQLANIYTTGIRADDMAVRLKYAGIDKNKITIMKNYDSLLDHALGSVEKGGTLYILPTYTAMLNIRKILRSRFDLKAFWK